MVHMCLLGALDFRGSSPTHSTTSDWCWQKVVAWAAWGRGYPMDLMYTGTCCLEALKEQLPPTAFTVKALPSLSILRNIVTCKQLWVCDSCISAVFEKFRYGFLLLKCLRKKKRRERGCCHSHSLGNRWIPDYCADVVLMN